MKTGGFGSQQLTLDINSSKQNDIAGFIKDEIWNFIFLLCGFVNNRLHVSYIEWFTFGRFIL